MKPGKTGQKYRLLLGIADDVVPLYEIANCILKRLGV